MTRADAGHFEGEGGRSAEERMKATAISGLSVLLLFAGCATPTSTPAVSPAAQADIRERSLPKLEITIDLWENGDTSINGELIAPGALLAELQARDVTHRTGVLIRTLPQSQLPHDAIKQVTTVVTNLGVWRLSFIGDYED